jgi:adenylate cyclase class 2
VVRGNDVEVELKYLGADLGEVRRRLEASGARLSDPRGLETNTVFDDDKQSLRGSERLLRLRNRSELTVKLPVADARYKSRREITVNAIDGDVEALLGGLGFTPTWRYEKYREGWDYDGMFVTLDEMPFVGAVVEIEGDRDRIDATAASLGLEGVPTSTASYRSLYDDHVRRHRLTPGDMTFDAERSLEPG